MSDAKILKECIALADELATILRLGNPLPANQDFSADEREALLACRKSARMKNVVSSSPAMDCLRMAISSKYLPALATAIVTTSPVTQPQAYAAYIQRFVTLLPASSNPYLRKFFREALLSAQFVDTIAERFLDGTMDNNLVLQGATARILCEAMWWSDPSRGDDKNACFDAALRDKLEAKVSGYVEQHESGVESAPEAKPAKEAAHNTVMVELKKTLISVRFLSFNGDAAYINGVRNLMEQDTPGEQGMCQVCYATDDDEDLLRCSRCKDITYCSPDCQKIGWGKGHRLRCFTYSF
ncbi:hypothetical protein CYLTODRAFT_440904 [Cylindrobasidium torrendii FP15055 ss-10]|uniref:MYND-type domain-containing protein n=1 Tax=Cylindrobasidium torrendii FP15055 ss-10 TaxID=1314674 RepID=A0A0D7BNB9_9AGAR|nr:hypothetical protein CYLTODRAFT_440904 [Cylindrobasidium torrendii FP15055 ss-10]